MLIGAALLIYPYFVESTVFTYIIGIVLTAALFLWKDED